MGGEEGMGTCIVCIMKRDSLFSVLKNFKSKKQIVIRLLHPQAVLLTYLGLGNSSHCFISNTSDNELEERRLARMATSSSVNLALGNI